MAHVIEITDGVTTVQLNSGAITATRYAPQSAPPQFGATETAGELGLTPYEYGNVAEGIELFIQDSTIAAVQTHVANIRKILESGKMRQTAGVGDRAFLQVQYEGEANKWRSEILIGRLILDDAADQISRLKITGLLSVTRRYYFERHDEVQLSMTSSETTTAATTAVIYNNDDADPTKTNHVLFAAAQITGQLPAPLRLRVTNAEASALSWREFFIGNYTFSPLLVGFNLGSSATGGATHTWANNNREIAWVWPLSNATLTRLAGRRYRVLLALSVASDDVRYRPEFQATSFGFPLEIGKEMLGANGRLFDVGALNMPPGGDNLNGTDCSVAISVLKIGTPGGGTVTADFMQITPAGEGLYRRWEQKGFQTAVGDGIEDNGPDGTVYYTDGTVRWPIIAGYGTPIHVWPNRDNKLRILMRESNFTAGRKMNVRAWFRPRRSDI